MQWETATPVGFPVCMRYSSVGLLFLYGALDSHPFFPSSAASGCCVLTAAAAGVPFVALFPY